MTKTKAIKQATSESDLYEFGGWILKTFDPSLKAYRENRVPDYWTGQTRLTDWRFNRVCVLLGYTDDFGTDDFGDYVISKYANDSRFFYGTLRQRVNRAVALENS